MRIVLALLLFTVSVFGQGGLPSSTPNARIVRYVYAASYQFTAQDCGAQIVFNNPSGVGAGFPSAFQQACTIFTLNVGAGSATLYAPPGATIAAGSTLVLPQNAGATLTSDGVNFLSSLSSGGSVSVINGTVNQICISSVGSTSTISFCAPTTLFGPVTISGSGAGTIHFYDTGAPKVDTPVGSFTTGPGLAVGGPLQGTAPTTVAVIGTSCTSGQFNTTTAVTDATSPTIGSTVAGSGAANAQVWCNGANWTVTGK